MMLAVFGTPSGLTYWVMNNARIAAGVAHGPCSLLTANSLEELRIKWAEREHKSVLFHADTPNRELVDLFTRVPGMAMLVTEPLERVVRFAHMTRALDPQGALRFATRSVCTLLGVGRRSDVWRIADGIEDLALDHFVEELAGRVFPQASLDQISEMKTRVLEFNRPFVRVGEAVQAFVGRAFGASGLNAGELLLSKDLTRTIAEFEHCIRPGGARRMTWPASSFVRLADLKYVDRPIDLVGPARVLIGGHSFSLPAGHWKATAEIVVRDNASGNAIFSDIFAEDHPVASGIVKLPENGAFSYALDFECNDPFYPLIFRIATMEGAIEGNLELNCVHFERLS